ncbi:MAG: TIGR02281 family clan AA aspartic protease [Yoonia sp.]|jgi:aspartyl protease family protein|tara:strand:- start:1042 stop:1620 length:579 start_codon:yes stop_codon:yes gene_type:complete
MSSDQTADAIYLSLLGGALLLSYLLASRINIGKMLQQMGIWVLIFMGAIAVIGMWPEIQRTITPRQSVVDGTTIVLPRARDGHYYLTLDINNVPVEFVVDTGASQVVLTQDDAKRIGLNPSSLSYLGTASTANGTVRTAAVRLDTVSLAAITDTNVRAVVNDGQMFGSLLGMTYLSNFDSITIKDGQLILSR